MNSNAVLRDIFIQILMIYHQKSFINDVEQRGYLNSIYCDVDIFLRKYNLNPDGKEFCCKNRECRNRKPTKSISNGFFLNKTAYK